MKQITIILLAIVLLGACTPNPEQVKPFVDQTLSALPTRTHYPTNTPFATFTPFPTLVPYSTFTKQPIQPPTPTKEIIFSATSTIIAKKKDHFSSEVQRIFADLACTSAIWEDQSFNLACVDVDVNSYEDLRLIAYRMTNIFALQWEEMELTQCFEDGFNLQLALMSSNQNFIIEANTSGKLLEKFLGNDPITENSWEEEAEIITH